MDTGAARVGDLVRGHSRMPVGRGNSLHRVLDDTFQEEPLPPTHRPCCPQHGRPRIALNFLTLLQQYFWPKMSMRRLRKMVARNSAQMEPIMAL